MEFASSAALNMLFVHQEVLLLFGVLGQVAALLVPSDGGTWHCVHRARNGGSGVLLILLLDSF